MLADAGRQGLRVTLQLDIITFLLDPVEGIRQALGQDSVVERLVAQENARSNCSPSCRRYIAIILSFLAFWRDRFQRPHRHDGGIRR